MHTLKSRVEVLKRLKLLRGYVNLRLNFFKSREQKLVVLRKKRVEEEVTNFDATLIF